MKKTKRFLLYPLLLLASLVVLTGCHKSHPLAAYEIPESFDTAQKYEIVFWAKNDTNNTQKKIYEQAITDFEKLYPNITVTLRQYTNYADIYNDVITNIATQTTPNICISYPDHIATYLSGENIVVPLEDFLYNEKYGLGGSELKYEGPAQDEIIKKFLDEGAFGSHYYALPFMRSTEACYINKNLVEALGYTIPETLTWDFIFEVSEAAMAKNEDGTFKVNGQKVMIPFIYKSTDNMMIQMLKQKNAGYSDASGNIDIFNDTTRELLYEIAKHAETRSFSTFKISSYPGNFLNAGQCIFAIDSTAGATWMGSNAPLLDISSDAIVDFETVVKPIPQYDPKNPQMISQGPSLCIFNKADTGEVLASWLFAQYLLTNEVQIAYAETEGYAPVTTKAQNSAEYKDYLSRCGEDNDKYYSVKIEATKILLDNTANTFTTPVFNGSASLRDAAGELIEKVTLAKRRKQPVNDEELQKMFDEVTSLKRLNEIVPTDGDTSVAARKRVLGALPAGSKALIIVLIIAWVGIIAYFVSDKVKTSRKEKQKS